MNRFIMDPDQIDRKKLENILDSPYRIPEGSLGCTFSSQNFTIPTTQVTEIKDAIKDIDENSGGFIP